MATSMRNFNPPCKEELEGVILTNSSYDDLESLTTQSSEHDSSSYGIRNAIEIELQNIAVAIRRASIAHRKSTEELSWFQFIFGNTYYAQM